MTGVSGGGGDDRSGWRFWWRFYVRRFFRIAPAYYVSLAAVTLLSAQVSGGYLSLQALDPARWAGHTDHVVHLGDHGIADLAAHVSFLFGLLPAYCGSSGLPDWSLSVEMQFYAVFPLIYMAARRFGVGGVCLALALVAMLLSHELKAVLGMFKEPSPLPIRFPMFMVGCLLYEAGRGRKPVLLAVAAVVLFLGGRIYGGLNAVLLDLCVAILACIWFVQPRGALEMILRSRPVQFISNTSYGLYLFHGFCLSILGSRIMLALGPGVFSALVMALAVLVTAYGLAWLVFTVVERPGIAIAKRLLHSQQPLGPPMT